MKLSATNLAVAILLGLIPAACHAQEFSADVVYLAISRPDAPSTGTATSPHGSSKLFIIKDRIRLETNALAGTILLADRTEHTAVDPPTEEEGRSASGLWPFTVFPGREPG
jgi:hypothetical protein